MEEFWEGLKNNKIYTIGFFILLVIIILSEIFIYFYLKYEFKSNNTNPTNDALIVEKEVEITKVIVEIKGEVLTPGVYEVNSNKRVNDVIKLAGGLTENASTKVNNLSKKVEDEMLIIIYSQKEIDNYVKTKETEQILSQKCNEDSLTITNSCITSMGITINNNKKISLNNATKEELMTLPGIGESKANAIINYRKEKKFIVIEELKEVSGIGEAIYAQIKDLITP